jgi:hypothetical protein
MDDNEEFASIIKFINTNDKYDNEKLYQIYNIIKNIKKDDVIIIYNNILKTITNPNSQNYNIELKDHEFLNKLFKAIKIIKNLNSEKINIIEVELYVNYYIYKNIDKNMFQEIIDYLKKLENENDNNLYKELWNKFLNPEKEKIINRNVDYYIDYNKTGLEDISKINLNIINNYIEKLIIDNKIKKIKYSIPNIETLFFLLLTDKI